MSDAFERAVERVEVESRRHRHKRRARGHRKGFRIHAAVFVAVEILLVVIWAVQWQLGGTSYPWFLWALCGWGIGLAAHYAAVRDPLRKDPV
jgi:2TM domain